MKTLEKRAARAAQCALAALALSGCLAPRGARDAGGSTTPPRVVSPEPVVSPASEASVPSTGPLPGDTGAARERVRATLLALAKGPRFALGHQDTTAYGVGWTAQADRSDVKSLCGSHVAIYGWDIFGIEKEQPTNGDGVDFQHMRRLIAEAHRQGGINTISWHADNPVSGGNAWDQKRAVHEILPGRRLHAAYRGYLDRVADFLASLKGDGGELIPIIFRPFHEHTGSWFWWGGAHTNAADYVALWRYTVDYLRGERGLENLLIAFSPGGGEVHKDADYLYRYPGDAYVDVFGIDHYYGNNGAELVRVAEIVVRNAEARGKIPAVTEFGARGGLNGKGINDDWVNASFLEPLRRSPVASRIAYALAWRNARADHCFLPYPDHPGAEKFRALCTDSQVVLGDDLPMVSVISADTAEGAEK